MKKKTILRWVATGLAAVLAFAVGYGVAVFAKDDGLKQQISNMIEDIFPEKEIDVSIEGETENVPHAPGGQEPSSEGDNTPAIPGFVIYYDTERYTWIEEDGATFIRFVTEYDIPPCEIEIRHIPNTTPADAAEATRADMLTTWPTVSEIEDCESPAGLRFSVANGMSWDSNCENIYFISDGQTGTYQIFSRYFIEAAEGHGARFAAMLNTFEIIAP